MGSRNKVLLASLVSMVMVLSFAIGLVPAAIDNSLAGASAAAPAVAITADGATPAGDSLTLSVGESISFSALGANDGVDWSLASDGSAELVEAGGQATVVAVAPGEAGLYLSSANGVDLVNLTIVAAAGDKALEAIKILTPADGSTVYVQAGASNVPYTVTSVTNDPDDTFTIQYELEGADIGESFLPPWAVNIADITQFITGVTATNTLVAAAATYDAYLEDGARITGTSNFSVVAGNFDEDGNGLPDFPFDLNLRPGDSWVANVQGTTRQVVIVPLVDNFKSIVGFDDIGATASIASPTNPDQVVTAFAPAGILESGNQLGYMILVVADTLEDLLDEGGDGVNINTFPGDGVVAGSRFADVSIIVTEDDGDTFEEITSPLSQEIKIEIQGVDTVPGSSVRAYSYDTAVTQGPVFINANPAASWAPVPNTQVGTGVVTARTNVLSVFAPFSVPDMVFISSIENITPDSLIAGSSQARATGGDTIAITVANADPGDTASITIAGSPVTVNSSSAVPGGVAYQVTAPTAAALAVPAQSNAVAVVVNVGGDADQGTLTYVGPTLTSISPAAGAQSGGTPVTITGGGLTGASVTIGGSPLGAAVVTANQVTGTTPPGEAGAAEVRAAYTALGYFSTLSGGFFYTSAPPIISVNPMSVLSDGGYTVRVSAGELGGTFVPPASGIDNEIYFTQNDTADPRTDLSADSVRFIDDRRLDVITPFVDTTEAVTLYNVYWTTSLYRESLKQDESPVSNFVEGFAFIDPEEAAYTIEQITPTSGPAAGGNTVSILGQFGEDLPPFQEGPPQPQNMQAFLGELFEGQEEIEFAPQELNFAPGSRVQLTLYHSRAPDAIGNDPASITFTVVWDPAVLSMPNPNPVEGFSPATRSDLLIEWYNKGIDVNFGQRPQGRLPVVLSGGSTFTPEFTTVSTSITTCNNQLPVIEEGDCSEQQNPFPLITLTFDVIGSAGSSTPLTLDAYAAADSGGSAVTTASALGTTLVIGSKSASKQGSGSELFDVAFGSQAATVREAGELVGQDRDRIDVTAPAVEDEAAAAAFEDGLNFPVDVRVTGADFNPNATDGSELLIAIAKDGYAYQPGPTREITGISPDQAWIFGGSTITIEGQGFLEDTETDPVVTFVFDELEDAAGEPLVLTAEIESISDDAIVVVVPTLPLDAEFEGRTTEATIFVEFGDNSKTTEEAGTFTYVKWTVTTIDAETSITTNAFFFLAEVGYDAGDTGLVLDGDALSKQVPGLPRSTTGTLTIPPLPQAIQDTTELVFGILRATTDGEQFGIGDEPGSDPFPGTAIPGIYNFDLHLYSGASPDEEFFVSYLEEDDFEGVSGVLVPVTPTVPVLTYVVPSSVVSDIEAGQLATWSRITLLESNLIAPTFEIPAATAAKQDGAAFPRPNTYALEALLAGQDVEIEPAESAATIRTRIHNLGMGAYALRNNAAPPMNLVRATIGNDGNDLTVDGTGGDQIVITGRNIYWAVELIGVLEGTQDGISFGGPVAGSRTIDPATGRERMTFIVPALEGGTYELFLQQPDDGGKQINLVQIVGLLFVDDDDDPPFPPFPFPFAGLIAALLTAVVGGAVALLGLLAGGSTSDSGSPCFIATAAYGSPMASEIEVLRTIRDSFLLSNPLGTAFVDAYYRVSPAMADVVAQSPVLAAVVRLLLLPVVFAGKMLLAMPVVSIGLLSVSLALATLRRRFSRGM